MRDARFPSGDDEADPASLALARALAGGAARLRTAVPGRPTPRSATDRTGRPGDAVGAAAADVTSPREAKAAHAEPGRTAYVSPAVAATQTARALGMVPRVAAELAEADAGRWRGLPYARVAEAEPEALAAWLTDPQAAPHGGESLAAMSARVAAWVEAMRATPDVIVVCDAGVIRAALGHALGVGPATAARFDIAPLSSTEITPAGDGWRVLRVNHRKAPL